MNQVKSEINYDKNSENCSQIPKPKNKKFQKPKLTFNDKYTIIKYISEGSSAKVYLCGLIDDPT